MVVHVDVWHMKVTWHLCVWEQQVALLLPWLHPKLAHLWELKAPRRPHTECIQGQLSITLSWASLKWICTYKHVLLCSRRVCNLSLAGGEYICYHCGRYSYTVCACSVALVQCLILHSSIQFYTKYICCCLEALFHQLQKKVWRKTNLDEKKSAC